MPILNTIQKRSLPGRILLAVFYILLTFGAVWMIYPFLIMLGNSVKTEVDYRQYGLIPRFLFDDEMLFRKFEEQRYGRIDIALAATRARDGGRGRLYSFESFPIPASSGRALNDWKNFLGANRETMPGHYFSLGHISGSRTVPELTFRYVCELRKAFPETPARDFKFISPSEEWPLRSYQPPTGPQGKVYRRMRNNLPERYFYPISLDGIFALNAVALRYGSGEEALQRLNREWGTSLDSVLDARLRTTLPENPYEQAIWTEYIRDSLSPRFLNFDDSLLPAYQQYLQNKYGRLAEYNAASGTAVKSWEEIRFPAEDAPATVLGDAALFVRSLTDLSKISVRSAEVEWRRYLKHLYGDLAVLNQTWATKYESFDEISMPILEYDWSIMRENKGGILWDFLTRNYRIAWDQVVMSGNGLRNTVIFCLLNILVALIVNPLAAYALSRFQPRWGHIALFLLMATMAFPGEVTQIPAFLLLRDMGWLNTFAALVIPAAANGYSIFLLKGFFDSLPRELYEAATIDGCGELKAFFTITLPLSAPILAVVSLGAFAAAYGAFMFALLVCQKETMWTLMVYIYQLQQSYNPPIVFAALVIAALPTLVVFVLCQNIIMKGIVVPVEK